RFALCAPKSGSWRPPRRPGGPPHCYSGGEPMTRIQSLTLYAGLAAASIAFAAGPYPMRVAPWSLISGLTKDEAELYLEDRRRKGFNSLIVNLIEHKFHGPVNRYGQG